MDIFKGGGVQTPPSAIFRISFRSEGKEVERKRKRNKMGGGGLIVNIFWGVEIFSSEVVIFSGGLRNFRGGGGKNYFLGGDGLRNFRGGEVEKFWGVWGWIEKFSALG